MGADATTVGGKAHHQIVKACVGHESEALQQCTHGVVVPIDAIDQQ